ncbi:adenylyltransferase/cytidyltransferase family protein [Candidatus Parcubacteria bacterium]|nr:adenylyltransferase/cytidyltransferase family protein [Candidatus Parcubacteria bacterium]
MKQELQKKVMAFGTFDIFHKGHENFLEQARQCGDCLIVVVARDKTVAEVKGNLPQNNEQARLKTVVKSGLADKVVLGNIKDKYKIIERFKPDVICLGYDQQAFTESLEEKLKEYNLLNTKIVRLKSYCPEKYKSSKFLK